jgi:hypothetical protein
MLEQRLDAHVTETREQFEAINTRLATGETLFAEIRDSLSTLCTRTQAVEDIKSDIGDIKELAAVWTTTKQAGRFASYVAKAAKWIAGMIGSIVALWVSVKAFAKLLEP